MLMTASDYRDSLRSYSPRVFINGNRVESVADEPLLAPGINGVGVTYDFAHLREHKDLMTAEQSTSGRTVNRMLHINTSSDDLLKKLEAVRLVCKVSGCAQRYLSHCRVALKRALPQSVWRTILRTGRFRRDSDDFKEALVARERCFRSKR